MLILLVVNSRVAVPVVTRRAARGKGRVAEALEHVLITVVVEDPVLQEVFLTFFLRVDGQQPRLAPLLLYPL